MKLDELADAMAALSGILAAARGRTVASTQFHTAVAALDRIWEECHDEIQSWNLYDPEVVSEVAGHLTRLVDASARRMERHEAQRQLRSLEAFVERELHEPYRDSPWALLRQGYDALRLEERPLLDESINALLATCHRACIVLGWCVASARVRHHVEHTMGLATYNSMSGQVVASKVPRLRRFSRDHQIKSAPEIERVPDAHLLAVLHLHGALDGGQFDALNQVLQRRNACAHPGRYFPGFHSCLSALQEIEEIVILNPHLA